MARKDESGDTEVETEVVVSGSNVESVAKAINATIDSESEGEEEINGKSVESEPEELLDTFSALEDAIEGLRIATEKDSRGKMRKKVMEYSGRDDMANWEFGRHLEVLKVHGIAEKDGKRWRIVN